MASVYNRGTKAAPNWWVAYIDADGRRRSCATGQPTKTTADNFAAAIVARVANGKVGIVERTDDEKRRSSITLADLETEFSAKYAPPGVKNIADYRKQTRTVFDVRILPTLGKRPAAAVTSLEVERLRDELLADSYAPKSVSWTLARLSKVYVWGRKMGLIECVSPVAGVDHPKGEHSLDFLSREEVGRLLAYVEANRLDIFAMVATALYCGLRKGELYGLRWCDVNRERAQLTVARSYTLAPKSGKVRHLPMHPELVRILGDWQKVCPATDEGLVFPVGDVALGYRMGKKSEMLGIAVVLKLAGCHVPKKPWHSLRHTFASHFIMAGGNILTLQKLLGHADLTMTLIYAHLAPDFMATEVARLSYAPVIATVTSMEDERAKRAREQSDSATLALRETNKIG